MPSKTFVLENVGPVKITKRRSNQNLKITLSPEGVIRVSIPTWTSYQAAVDFVNSRKTWINERITRTNPLYDGQQIGKAHHLTFKPIDNVTSKPHSRISGNQIIIKYPHLLGIESEEVQSVAILAATRALRLQAENLLTARLISLASVNGLNFSSISIKAMRRRWGSCDQKQKIVLNLYLVQLPWELIDYVILHELTHTKHLNHGKDFWDMLESMQPKARENRRQLNNFAPIIINKNNEINLNKI